MKPYSKETYLTVVFISIIIHLVFVTMAEGAFYLNRLLITDPPEVIFKTSRAALPMESKMSVNKMHLPKPIPSKNNDKVNEKGPSTKPMKPIDKELSQFKESQKEINERIKKFKSDLIMKQLSTVSMKIYDLEKIEIKFKKDTLDLYLKKMRSKIARKWLANLSSYKCDSCQATVQYQLDSLGSVFGVSILDSNSDIYFGASCTDAVKDGSPFGVLPFEPKVSSQNRHITVVLTFYFEGKKIKK